MMRGESEQTLLQCKQQSDLIEQLTADTQRDLTMLGYLPDVDPHYMRRLLEVSVNEVFRHCIV